MVSLNGTRNWILGCTSVILLFLTISGFFGKYARFLELTCHFRLQYLFAGVLLALSLSFFRFWKLLTIAIVAIILNAYTMLPLYLHRPETHNKYELRIISFNLFFKNRHYDQIVSFMQHSNADVLLLQETTQLALKRLDILKSRFPYSRYQASRNTHGLAIFSRYRIIKFESSNFNAPYLLATIKVNGTRVDILNTHLHTPTSSIRFENRNSELQDLASIVQTSSSSIIVGGDLNTSIWSPYYSAFKEEAHLKDSRTGFGLKPTWPTVMPLVMIPIDHFLVSTNIDVVRLQTGPTLGSDHLPLVLDVTLPHNSAVVELK
jgi:endonuclease/exonuclease/phosphatase (EEP) superfamily protein YafD